MKVKYLFMATCIVMMLFANTPLNVQGANNAGVEINGVVWATCNVDAPGTFAASPESAGMFYQWNRKVGWSSTDPMVNSDGGTEWDNSFPSGNKWEVANDPCSEGWRVPTTDEQRTLIESDKVTSEWATLNGVSGRRFTDKSTGNSLFLPAAGERINDGRLFDDDMDDGYWSSPQNDSYYAFALLFTSATSTVTPNDRKNGYSVRCVAEEKSQEPESTTSYFSNFNDNVFDSSFWTKETGYYMKNGTYCCDNSNDIRVEDGVMKLEQNVTDITTYLWTNSLNFSESITMERDVYLYAANSYYSANTIFMFDNEKHFTVHYWSDSYLNYYNFAIGIDDAETLMPIQTGLVFDRWFHEKIIFDKDGKLRYYHDNIFIGEYDVSSVTSGASSFKIRFSPYGWWTGHKHYFDNFSVNGYHTTIPSVTVPTIQLSSVLLQPGETLTVTGRNFTPNGQVVISSDCTSDATTVTANTEGAFTAEVSIPAGCPAGLYTLSAKDMGSGKSVAPVQFRVKEAEAQLAESNIRIVYPNNPNIICRTGNELIVLWDDLVSVDNRYQILHEDALREYSYFVELEMLDSETEGGTVADMELGGMASLGKTESFQCSFHPEKAGTYIVRVWDKVTDLFVESAPFFVEDNSGQLNIVKKWDYSADESLMKPLRNREPKGVAADGTSRIYLSVTPKAGTKYIKNTSLTLKDEKNGYSDTRLLGKAMPATVTDRYSDEANNANATTAENRTAGQSEYVFWYVAPDDFTGSDGDRNESTRLVKAEFDVTFTDNTFTKEYCYIEIARPALMLVHGLGSSGSKCWGGFSLRNGVNITDDKRFIVAEAIDVWPDVTFEKNARGLLNMIEPKTPRSTFEAINLLMMNRGYASNRADYICHSMGGCILRYATEHFPDRFKSVGNYQKGFTNKVITVNTPHEGSPISDMLESILDYTYSNKYVEWGNEVVSMFYDLNNLYENYRDEQWAFNPFNYISPTQIEPHTLQNLMIWYKTLINNNYEIPFTRKFQRSAAVRDLSLQGGVRFYQPTPVNAHLIAGDMFAGIQDWHTMQPLDFDSFNGFFSKYKGFKKTLNIIEKGLYYYLRVKEINGMAGPTADFEEFKQTITDLAKVTNDNEKQLKVMDTYLKIVNRIILAANTVSFVADCDFVVPLKSQLAGDYTIPNKTIINGFGANHLSVVNNVETENAIENLLQSSIKSTDKFRIIQSSLRSGNSTLRNSSSEKLPSMKFYKANSEVNENKLVINSPTSGAIAGNDELSVNLQIKDMASLEYVELEFQGEVYRQFDVAESNIIFNLPVDKSELGNCLLTAKAYYFYPDSMYTAYAGALVNVVTEEIPVGLSCSQKVFRCGKNEVVRPGYEVAYQTFLYRFGVDTALHANVLKSDIVQFNPGDCSFTAKEIGATYVELEYKGLKDTVYFVVDLTIAGGETDIKKIEVKVAEPSNISIFPNPARDELHIRSEQPVEKIEIYDLVGRLKRTNNPRGNEAVNLSSLPAGVYVVRIYTDEGVTEQKLVKE